MPGLTLTLLSDAELQAADHPELTVLLAVEGITHDPTGRRPPERLEVRLSPKALRNLYMQIRAVQKAQVVPARARAEQETQRERARAAEVATDGSRADTGTLRRVVMALKDKPPDHVMIRTSSPPPEAVTVRVARPAAGSVEEAVAEDAWGEEPISSPMATGREDPSPRASDITADSSESDAGAASNDATHTQGDSQGSDKDLSSDWW